MNKKTKILIADDMKKIAEDNKNIVSQNVDIEIVGMAFNGQEELKMILELEPDLVITDNKMPLMNGIDVVKEINSLKLNNKLDFILITGDLSAELNNKCREEGVYMILDKLTAREKLLSVVNDYSMSNRTSNNMKSNQTFKLGFLEKMRKKLKKEV